MAKTIFKPGMKSTFSGVAVVIGVRGGDTGHEITIDRGEKFPPTPERGQSYAISRRAHNKAGHGK